MATPAEDVGADHLPGTVAQVAASSRALRVLKTATLTGWGPVDWDRVGRPASLTSPVGNLSDLKKVFQIVRGANPVGNV